MVRKLKLMSTNFKLNWILNEELAVGTPPRGEKHIGKLQKEGIKSIISLCSEKEHSTDIKLSQYFHHERYVLADHKTGKTPTIDELNKTLFLIKKHLNYGPVFVHCYAAVERSPLVCMAWLVKENKLNPQQALEYVMRSNPGTNPLPNQLKLLNKIVS